MSVALLCDVPWVQVWTGSGRWPWALHVLDLTQPARALCGRLLARDGERLTVDGAVVGLRCLTCADRALTLAGGE